jgi:hypothetical protein
MDRAQLLLWAASFAVVAIIRSAYSKQQTPTFTRSNKRWKEEQSRASQFQINAVQFQRMQGQITRD